MRTEDGKWKIYRVRNVTDNFEQRIFDDAAIEKARAYARELPNI